MKCHVCSIWLNGALFGLEAGDVGGRDPSDQRRQRGALPIKIGQNRRIGTFYG